MEPARSTGNFNRRITVADSNNIVSILDMNIANSKYQIFEEDYLIEIQAVLEDLKVTVGLTSLAEAPWPETNALMSETAKMAEIAKVRSEGQKISLGLYVAFGNGPWQYESEVVLQNQGGAETHVPILVPFLSSNETLLMAGDFKLGVKVEPKWNQPLGANDYLIIKGTWRQVVSFSKKKDDDVEFLAARIEALELALFGRLTNLPANSLLGRGSTIGVAEIIPQSTFAKPADIDTAILNLIGAAPTALNTLDELAQALNDDQNFAANLTSYLAGKVSLTGDETISGVKTFGSTVEATSLTVAGFKISGGAAISKSLFVGGRICPVSPPATEWGIDFTRGASTITLAPGATYDLATGSGMVVIYDNVDGHFNFMFAAAGSVYSATSTPSGSVVAGVPPADKVGFFYNAPSLKYRIQNNRSSSRTLVLSTIKMRSVS